MAISLDQLVHQLTESGLIEAASLATFVPPQAHPQTAEDLLRQLVKNNRLTKFQAQQLAQGKGKALILGGYIILDRIGAGGMGQVYKAQHRRMDREVAIKMLPPATMRDKAAVARFDREVKAAAKLSHSNVVAAYDADEANGAHFLVMEYVPGTDLSSLVKKHGPLPLGKALNYVLQAARGLEFAHKKGVIHRDIKPANLLVDSDGIVKILDMGLARFDGPGAVAGQAELTSSGAVMGTIDYMAPEQAMSTHHADARADIYSLGCTLHYLLTGRATFEGDTLIAKMIAHREAPIPRIATPLAGVSDEVQTIFAKMLAKNASDRYQSMTEVIADLERAIAADSSPGPLSPPAEGSGDSLTSMLRELPAPTSRHRSTTAAAKRQTKTGRGRLSPRMLYGSIAGGVLFLVGIPLLWFALPRSQQDSQSVQKEPLAEALAIHTTGNAGPPVDLFQHIDVKAVELTHKGKAVWSWAENPERLIGMAGNVDRVLPIKFNVPARYVLNATVETAAGERPHPVTIGLRRGTHRFALQFNRSIGGKADGTMWSGLSLVDGKPASQNETGVQGQLLASGAKQQLQIEVTSDAITAAVDGKQFVNYLGSQSRLSLPLQPDDPRGQEVGDSDLWLMIHDRVVIYSLQLTPLLEPVNYALRFTPGTYVGVSSLRLPTTGPITLEALVTLSAPPIDRSVAFVVGVNRQCEINIPTAGQPRTYTYPAGAEKIVATMRMASVSPLRQPTHLASVWDAGKLALFLNGRKVVEKTGAGGALVAPPDSFRIAGEHFDGVIDEVRVSKSVRYFGNYDRPKRFESDSDTLALYHFDEGQGDEVRDSSGNDHHGKIIGAKWAQAEATVVNSASQPATP